MNNPLLNFDQTPFFNTISAEHVLPALNEILAESRDKISTLEKIEHPSWDNFAAKLEELDERINRVWSPISHLNGVADSSNLREVYQQGIELLTEFNSQVGQNHILYQAYKTLAKSAEFEQLNNAQKKVVSNALLDFKLSGAELDAASQSRLTELNQRLSALSTNFEQNLLDATQSWSLHVTDESRLKGLPKAALEAASTAARSKELAGWSFSLQIPSYLAIMQHAEDEDLREQMYKAYAMRASELNDDAKFDNAPIIEQILSCKHEKATLLGFQNFAEYSLVKKMAKDSASVIDFLDELAAKAKPYAQSEVAELNEFGRTEYGIESLKPWDLSFYSERLREHLYDYSDEEVRGYFPAPKVLTGLFDICSKLFGIEIKPNSTMQVWHNDVECFDVFDSGTGTQLGSLYSDLYVRDNKRGGAWMGSCIDRRKLENEIQLPVAFLNCNFNPPTGEGKSQTPALLSHSDVETVFHEFGHSLHHLLTQVDESSVAGINGVAWDAVELPSQFLENWCWQDEGLALISQHYQTGEAIPKVLLEKMRSAKHFQAGMQTVRQVEFSLFDMRLHSQNTPTDIKVQDILNSVREQVAVVIPPSYNRFQNSFGHIFAGGYAAGYYSYKWAEVLSADAFARFEEDGIFNPQTGRDFLTEILHKGGVYDANDLFIAFRKRAPTIDALLRHSGLDTIPRVA